MIFELIYHPLPKVVSGDKSWSMVSRVCQMCLSLSNDYCQIRSKANFVVHRLFLRLRNVSVVFQQMMSKPVVGDKDSRGCAKSKCHLVRWWKASVDARGWNRARLGKQTRRKIVELLGWCVKENWEYAGKTFVEIWKIFDRRGKSVGRRRGEGMRDLSITVQYIYIYMWVTIQTHTTMHTCSASLCMRFDLHMLF